LRIAYVITRGDSVGGASIHVRDLALAMQQRGHEVLVLVGGCGPVTDELARIGVPFQTIPSLVKAVRPFRDTGAVLQTARALRDWSPDLVSAHTAKAGFVGRAAARLTGIPAIYTPHGWSVGNRLGRARGRVFGVVEKIAAPWAAAIVNVCEAERQLALDQGIGRVEQHHVIYNGVHDVEPQLRANPGDPIAPVRFVSVARFEAPKDHATLFAAFAELGGSGRWHLDLIGDGPDEQVARLRVEQLGLAEQVTFHGYLADPAPVLSRAHAFVLSSRSEGFPRSILEAMRAGLPVVATDVGGIHESVGAENGVLVGAGDPGSLRIALQNLMLSPVRRQRLGDMGHLIYSRRFRFAQMLEATESLYGRVT